MKYTEENILHSASGYCMPFEEPSKEPVNPSSIMALTLTSAITCCQLWPTERSQP